jgi:hypothetical protein
MKAATNQISGQKLKQTRDQIHGTTDRAQDSIHQALLSEDAKRASTNWIGFKHCR